MPWTRAGVGGAARLSTPLVGGHADDLLQASARPKRAPLKMPEALPWRPQTRRRQAWGDGRAKVEVRGKGRRGNSEIGASRSNRPERPVSPQQGAEGGGFGA